MIKQQLHEIREKEYEARLAEAQTKRRQEELKRLSEESTQDAKASGDTIESAGCVSWRVLSSSFCEHYETDARSRFS